MRAILFLALLALSAPAVAQTGREAILDRLNSVDPNATTEADCDRQIARAEDLNALDLLYGAAVCFAVRRPVDGSFLLNAGQLRAVADAALMVPATRADSEVITSLGAVIYFQAGGPGDEAVFRDPTLRERFFALFDGWSPHYPPEYNPGWNTRRRADPEAYRSIIMEAKAGRRQQLGETAQLLSDDVYDGLNRRFQELQARNPRGFEAGTPDAELSADLIRQMDERAAALGLGLRSGAATAAEDPGEERFPPEGPAADEEVLAASDDPAVQRCIDLAERLTIAADSRVLRVLITRSAEWGIIWRADIAEPERSVMRFTCTRSSTAMRPVDIGVDPIPPLPDTALPPAPGE